jgi:MarR family transcriptional regulator, organic hydroperoxide resistance regulator
MSRENDASIPHKQREALIEQLQFLGQMASTETALFHQMAAAKYGLGITDMKTISILQQEGAMTAGQIAKRLSLTTGAVTNVIDRLERRDLVRREPDAHDRRKVIVVANQEQIEAIGAPYRSMGATFETLLRTFSTEELAFLARYSQAAIELTKQEIAKLTQES